MYLEINVCSLRGKIVNVSGLMCQSVSLCQHNTRGEHNFIYGAENIEELHLKHSEIGARRDSFVYGFMYFPSRKQ